MPRKIQGFTLLELLVAITLLIIVASVACINYSPLINRIRVNTMSHQLTSIIQFAQLNALTYQQQMILTPYQQQNWSSGWKLFSTDQTTGQQTLLREFSNTHNNLHIQLAAFPQADKLQWQADGLLTQNNGHFTISLDSIQQQLIINKAGRIRTEGIGIRANKNV